MGARRAGRVNTPALSNEHDRFTVGMAEQRLGFAKLVGRDSAP